MLKINPYLMVKNGKEAIKLYKDLFGAKLVEHMPFAKEAAEYFGFPDDFDYENSTMHAILDIGGAIVMLSDNPMGKSGSGNVLVLITYDTKEELEKINAKVLEKKFTIVMPLGKALWFEDPYGIGWMLAFSEDQ